MFSFSMIRLRYVLSAGRVIAIKNELFIDLWETTFAAPYDFQKELV